MINEMMNTILDDFFSTENFKGCDIIIKKYHEYKNGILSKKTFIEKIEKLKKILTRKLKIENFNELRHLYILSLIIEQCKNDFVLFGHNKISTPYYYYGNNAKNNDIDFIVENTNTKSKYFIQFTFFENPVSDQEITETYKIKKSLCESKNIEEMSSELNIDNLEKSIKNSFIDKCNKNINSDNKSNLLFFYFNFKLTNEYGNHAECSKYLNYLIQNCINALIEEFKKTDFKKIELFYDFAGERPHILSFDIVKVECNKPTKENKLIKVKIKLDDFYGNENIFEKIYDILSALKQFRNKNISLDSCNDICVANFEICEYIKKNLDFFTESKIMSLISTTSNPDIESIIESNKLYWFNSLEYCNFIKKIWNNDSSHDALLQKLIKIDEKEFCLKEYLSIVELTTQSMLASIFYFSYQNNFDMNILKPSIKKFHKLCIFLKEKNLFKNTSCEYQTISNLIDFTKF